MKKTLYILTALVILSCAKDELHETSTPALSLEDRISSISTNSDALSFLQDFHPEFDKQRIDEIRDALNAPPERLQRSGNSVDLAAGSVDGLQAAIDEAGEGGTVVIKSGDHRETGLVTVAHEIHIVGEERGVLTFENEKTPDLAIPVSAGLHFIGASNSTIRDLHASGMESGSGNFLLIEESHNVGIFNSNLTNFQYSISVEECSNTRVDHTTIQGWTGWLEGLGSGSLGVTIINGSGTRLVGNTISGCQFGQWMCDRGGLSWGNTTTGNFYGQILCNVPSTMVTLPSGEVTGSQMPGRNWLLAMNNDFNNFYAGIVVIDGANTNTLLANRGGGNGAYDLELTTDTERFGFLTPKAYDNYVFSFADYAIKDCGENNRVSGGDEVDTGSDQCN